MTGILAAATSPTAEGDSVVVLLLAAAGLLVSYAVSIRRNPWVKCRRCNGAPRRQGWFYTHAHGFCGKCGGSGQKPRWGSRVFGRDQL